MHFLAAGRLINAVEHRQLHHPPVQNHARILKSLNVWALSRPNTTHPEQNQTLEAPGLHLFGCILGGSSNFLSLCSCINMASLASGMPAHWKSIPVSQLRTYRNATTLFNIFQRDFISVRPFLAVYEDFYHRRHSEKQRFLGMPPWQDLLLKPCLPFSQFSQSKTVTKTFLDHLMIHLSTKPAFVHSYATVCCNICPIWAYAFYEIDTLQDFDEHCPTGSSSWIRTRIVGGVIANAAVRIMQKSLLRSVCSCQPKF